MFNDENNELITGDQKGKIIIWSLKIGKTIFDWRGHQGVITQMFYDSGKKILITGGKDKKIIFWKLSEKWEDEELKNVNNLKKKKIKILMVLLQCLNCKKFLKKIVILMIVIH